MILVAGSLRYPPGAIEKLKGEMQKMIATTRAEDGCLDYNFAVDVSDPTRLIIFERWRDQKALDAHFASAHMAAWREASTAAGPATRDVLRWETDAGQTL